MTMATHKYYVKLSGLPILCDTQQGKTLHSTKFLLFYAYFLAVMCLQCCFYAEYLLENTINLWHAKSFICKIKEIAINNDGCFITLMYNEVSLGWYTCIVCCILPWIFQLFTAKAIKINEKIHYSYYFLSHPVTTVSEIAASKWRYIYKIYL